jgi:putative pyruvate formate lyase activating enzyme
VVTVERLAEIFLELQEQGAHTLDLVTPTHQVPNVAMALSRAKKQGLHLPVVYNCGGYESPEILKHLEGLVDVWMPDMKYSDPALAARLSGAKDYVEAAKSALEEMVRQQPTPVFNEEGIMEKGVLVRHLVLPGYLKNSRGVLKYLWDTYQSSIWLSLMSQYTPLRAFPGEPSLERSLTKREYEKMVTYALELGFTNAYIQGGEVARESFIPDFDQTGVSEEHRD